jgi:hypothetical protein
MLSYELVLRLEHEGEDTMDYGCGELDSTDAAAVSCRRQPAVVVVNCAA